RVRFGGPALLLGGEHQEPPGELLPDDQAETHGDGRMKTFIGIDLGSTTTKAVVIDEHQNVLGRGITNSRSNYDTAAAIAKEEALGDSLFFLFRQALGSTNALNGSLDAFLGQLERDFRSEQYLEQ